MVEAEGRGAIEVIVFDYFLAISVATAIICTGIICYGRGYRSGVAHCTVQLAVLENEMREVHEKLIRQRERE